MDAEAKKRRQYISHKNKMDELEPFFVAMTDPAMPQGAKMRIAVMTKTPYTTVTTWGKVLKVGPTWRPSREAYKAPQRVFIDEEDNELMLRVQFKYLKHNLLFTDELFQKEALELRRDVIERLEAKSRLGCKTLGNRYRDVLEFKASGHFVADFRERHKVWLKRPPFKRSDETRPRAFTRSARDTFSESVCNSPQAPTSL
jgi:hypothetical protein